MYALIDERIVLVRLLEYWKNVEDCLVPLLLRNSRKNWERRNVNRRIIIDLIRNEKANYDQLQYATQVRVMGCGLTS